MKATLTNSVLRLASPFRLAGPLFDKELRVSSRRRRNYVLRSIFIMLLSVFVATVWLGVVESEYSAVFQKSRMAVAGKTIISTIVWFQFVTTQLIAVIMLSTSISDEIHHGTLGLLMTTPISSFHIVMGKLFSKLLQIILLLAISLPLLAVVRVFGGVPANYLLSSLCITLTAVILAGCLSLLFSISNRRAYVVIIKTAFTLAFFFGFVPTMGVTLLSPRWLLASAPPNIASPLVVAFLHLNPFGAMSMNTTMMISPIIPLAMPTFYWPLHCALMLAASGILIGRSVHVVRKVALRQATGQLDLLPKRRSGKRQKKKSIVQSGKSTQHYVQSGIIRRVSGSPVLWKEIRAPMIRGVDSRNSIIGLVITIIALLLTYAVCEKEDCLDEAFAHVTYMLMFVFIGSIFTMVLASSCISSEKESRAWPVMLATSMDDWHILLGKAGGVFRRCLPIWLLLAGHIVFFICMRYIHPIAVIHSAIFVAGLASFLTGVGIYFSARFKRTTSAVVANLAVAVALWVIIPAMAGLILQFTRDRDHRSAFEMYVSANPAVQVVVVMDGAGGAHNARTKLSRLNYDWPRRHSDWSRVWGTTRVLIVYMLINVSVGFLFAWRAKCRFRRNVF
jgi:ABC-type transport system involved in multi-copper enzyme maturation permease subunit